MTDKLKLDNIIKRFKSPGGDWVTAVDRFSLSISSGSFVTLLGPSGCGKTTTLRMIAGFETPDSGAIYIDNHDVTAVPPNKRELAMVFQSYALFPHLTVGENVAYSLKIRKIPSREIRDRVKNVLELVGLESMEKRYPNQLSGGQQQRVALARAIVLSPKVLLFDEPLSNLDAKLREEMRDKIRELQKQIGITAIYVTHDQVEAMTMSDVIVVMNKGRIEQVGSPDTIYERPASSFVANFIGRVNLLEADLIKPGDQELELQVLNQSVTIRSFSGMSQKMAVAVRPEGVELMPADHWNGPVFAGKLEKKIYVGQHVEYTVKLDSGAEILAVALGRPCDIGVGEPVTVGFKPEMIHGIAAS